MLISMFGIGDENKQMNLPRESQRTPPIAALSREGLMEASTFHFKHSVGGGTIEMRWDLQFGGYQQRLVVST